mgnify:CR=1 FL=1|tara:strand:+ start:171527 stop:172378 length:852 start_codon:yes stop_codon:yes gene_type:complete
MTAAANIREIVLFAALAAASCLSASLAHAEGPKAVSLDFCADQYLLALADPVQIMAVTKMATNENSYFREKATGLNQFGGTVEEILKLRPDVVIGTDWAFMTLPVLSQYDIETTIPDYGHQSEVFFRNIARFGDALSRSDQARTLIENYQKRLDALKSIPMSELTAAYITPSGYTGGTGTFIDDAIKLAGYSSFAETHNIVGWQPISLETLLLNPPDLIVSSFFDQNDVHVSHWSLIRHPKIEQMMSEIPTISIPGNLISCGGLFSIEIAEYVSAVGKKEGNK